uniref:Tf2-1-like SH3-like domain-containing protein n=1 Tax=Cajanus cajan TaxID=3821 RepID=A0A151SIK0_CAJCA|nr:hypothetical protein KK1_000869 [Cajanus cajan]
MRYFGPFEVIAKVGEIAYKLKLPNLARTQCSIFLYLRNLNFIRDLSYVVEMDEMQVRENLTYEKRPVAVVDHKLKKLRGKSISLVKILWDAATGEVTREVESQFKEQYPFLFSGKPIFGDENSYLLGGIVT